RERLAAFKVPGLIRIVPEIPKGPAGKIKRDALAAALSIAMPDARVKRRGKVRAPRSDLERQLADCWMELLELDELGIDENVLMLGVDSIIVTQMLLRLHDWFGLYFSFEDILDAPTVEALAGRIESSGKNRIVESPGLHDAPGGVEHFEGDGPPPMSVLQEH